MVGLLSHGGAARAALTQVNGVLRGLVLGVALASSLVAQPGTARVRGSVHDTSGVPIPLAQITIHKVVAISDSASAVGMVTA